MKRVSSSEFRVALRRPDALWGRGLRQSFPIPCGIGIVDLGYLGSRLTYTGCRDARPKQKPFRLCSRPRLSETNGDGSSVSKPLAYPPPVFSFSLTAITVVINPKKTKIPLALSGPFRNPRSLRIPDTNGHWSINTKPD